MPPSPPVDPLIFGRLAKILYDRGHDPLPREAFRLLADRGIVTIWRWDVGQLGPKPTMADLAAVSDADAKDAIVADQLYLRYTGNPVYLRGLRAVLREAHHAATGGYPNTGQLRAAEVRALNQLRAEIRSEL